MSGDSAPGEEQPQVALWHACRVYIKPGIPQHSTQFVDGKTLEARDAETFRQNLVGIVFSTKFVEFADDLIDQVELPRCEQDGEFRPLAIDLQQTYPLPAPVGHTKNDLIEGDRFDFALAV